MTQHAGLFKPGQSGNPKGRPKKFTIHDFITPEEVGALVDKAKELAGEGKTDMIKLLIEHSLGKPAQKHVGAEEGDGYTPLVVKIIHESKETNNNENTG